MLQYFPLNSKLIWKYSRLSNIVFLILNNPFKQNCKVRVRSFPYKLYNLRSGVHISWAGMLIFFTPWNSVTFQRRWTSVHPWNKQNRFTSMHWLVFIHRYTLSVSSLNRIILYHEFFLYFFGFSFWVLIQNYISVYVYAKRMTPLGDSS